MPTELVQWCDVMSLDDWALEMVPQPCVGVGFVFPVSAASEKHRGEEEARIAAGGQTVSPKVYHCLQTVSNACGTICMLHCVANADLPLTGFWAKFLADTKDQSGQQRAEALEGSVEIEAAHVASAEEGQSKQVDDADNVNNHFIAFSLVDGCVYELDGRKARPINHGPSSPATFLVDVAKVCREFMARDPEEVRFTVVALAAPGAD